MRHWYKYGIGRSSVPRSVKRSWDRYFPGFAIYLRARARTPDLRSPPITERRMQFFETERNARRTRVVQSRTDCMNNRMGHTCTREWYVPYISDPYRFPIVLSSNLEYIRSNDDDDDDPTGMQMRVTRALASGNCNCSSKNWPLLCNAPISDHTRLLENIKYFSGRDSLFAYLYNDFV